jgi:hypothetical protein
MGLATMQPGTLNHTTGTAIAKVAKEKAGLNALVQPTAGESVIIPLVGRGEAEFGIANALEVSVAVENNRLPELRLIGAIHPLPTAFFVRKDTTMRTIADLKGRKVVFGFSAQRTLDQLSRAILATGGLTERDINPVLVPNVIRGADDFVAGGGRYILLRVRRAEGARGGRHRWRHPRARSSGSRDAGSPQGVSGRLSGAGGTGPVLHRRREADGRLHLGQSLVHQRKGEGRRRLQDDRGDGQE